MATDPSHAPRRSRWGALNVVLGLMLLIGLVNLSPLQPIASESPNARQFAALQTTIGILGLAIVYVLWRILQAVEAR